jgi:hypothetical protein
LVEQRTENPCVPGSIPGGTTFKPCKTLYCRVFWFYGDNIRDNNYVFQLFQINFQKSAFKFNFGSGVRKLIKKNDRGLKKPPINNS